MLAPKNETTRLTDADLGDHSDNLESYAAMSTEALNMAHCCNAFLNAAQGFVLNVLVAENIFGNMTSTSRWEIFGNGPHNPELYTAMSTEALNMAHKRSVLLVVCEQGLFARAAG